MNWSTVPMCPAVASVCWMSSAAVSWGGVEGGQGFGAHGLEVIGEHGQSKIDVAVAERREDRISRVEQRGDSDDSDTIGLGASGPILGSVDGVLSFGKRRRLLLRVGFLILSNENGLPDRRAGNLRRAEHGVGLVQRLRVLSHATRCDCSGEHHGGNDEGDHAEHGHDPCRATM